MELEPERAAKARRAVVASISEKSIQRSETTNSLTTKSDPFEGRLNGLNGLKGSFECLNEGFEKKSRVGLDFSVQISRLGLEICGLV